MVKGARVGHARVPGGRWAANCHRDGSYSPLTTADDGSSSRLWADKQVEHCTQIAHGHPQRTVRTRCLGGRSVAGATRRRLIRLCRGCPRRSTPHCRGRIRPPRLCLWQHECIQRIPPPLRPSATFPPLLCPPAFIILFFLCCLYHCLVLWSSPPPHALCKFFFSSVGPPGHSSMGEKRRKSDAADGASSSKKKHRSGDPLAAATADAAPAATKEAAAPAAEAVVPVVPPLSPIASRTFLYCWKRGGGRWMGRFFGLSVRGRWCRWMCLGRRRRSSKQCAFLFPSVLQPWSGRLRGAWRRGLFQ